jgi:replication factor A2
MWNSNNADQDYMEYGGFGANNTSTAGNGGGFMQDDGPSSSAKSEGRENRVIVSVNTNQLHNLFAAGGLVMHRQKIPMVRLVGRLVSVNEQSTKVTYTVSDGTGPPIDVGLFRVSGDGSPILMENSYVRAIGQPRQTGSDSTFIMGFSVQPIDSLNEYAVHWLEVLDHANYYLANKTNLMYGDKKGAGERGHDHFGGGNSAAAQSGNNPPGMSDVQKLVFKIINESSANSGISRQELHSSLKSITPATIDKSLEFLLTEGHVFTTINDDHFRATDF